MEARPTELLLESEGLTRSVSGKVLWRNLRISLHASECVALTGPSGSGKTLLLRALAGLDPIEAGRVIFRGRDQAQWPMPQFRAQVSYVSQRVALFPGSVRDNLARPFELSVHRDRRFDVRAALDELRALGKDEAFLSLEAANLSGGERQVVALVRTLLIEPSVLLLDEVTASLDPASVQLTEARIGRWLKEGANRACLWVSHDPRQVSRIAPRAVSIGESTET